MKNKSGQTTTRAVLAIKEMNDLDSLQQAIYSDPLGRINIVAIAPTAETFQQNTLDLAPDIVVADARYAMDMGEPRFPGFFQIIRRVRKRLRPTVGQTCV